MNMQEPVTPGLLHTGPADMTSANLVTLSVWLGAVIAVSIIAVIGVAHLRRQHFRHRIEAIRDDGADAIFDGRLRLLAPVTTFLGGLDLLAACAPWASLTALAAALPYLLPGGDSGDLPEAYHDLSVGELYIIGELRARLWAALRYYLIWPLLLKPAGPHELVMGRRP